MGVGGRLHKVLGQINLGKLDSGERSLPFGLLVTTLEGIVVWDLIVSVPDHCLSFYYATSTICNAISCFPIMEAQISFSRLECKKIV